MLAPALKLVIDQARARALGLDPSSIGQSLQTLLSATPVTVMRDGAEQVQVVARAVPNERLDLGRIDDLTILSRDGAPAPLAQVASKQLVHEEAILYRRNRDMVITARADVVDGAQAPDVTAAIWPKLADLRASMPAGYHMEIGGTVEESQKGNASILKVFTVMMIAISTLLMVQLQSFEKLALVFSTVPLGIIGASLALNVTRAPFGFVALLGLIALAGMIMRIAVIRVDQIDHDVADG